MKPKIIIVNEDNQIIAHKYRSDVKTEDIYRVSALHVANSEGQVLLAQRKFTKNHDPGKWGPAVAGTVEEGESYEDNIKKEAFEEIGLTGIEFEKWICRRNRGEHNYFSQQFRAIVDKKIEDFTIQEEEVEQIKWFSKDEINELFNEKPEMFINSFGNYIKLYSEEK